jgi:two-component system sensor histidine kinase HydH
MDMPNSPSKLRAIFAASRIPSWVLLGSVAVLVPIFAVATFQWIDREKEFTTRLLLEKGAALIRSFEAGTRTGMMGMHRGAFQLQNLLSETARQPDIAHLIVTDLEGRVLAHSDLGKVGGVYGKDLDLAGAPHSKQAAYRVVKDETGAPVFEVYRRFEPASPPRLPPRGPMGRRALEGFEQAADPPRMIFVGLDMTAVEAARRADVLHAVVMGAVLLTAGFAGITLLMLTQSYRAARSTLSRVQAFSDHVVANVPIGLVAIDGCRRIALVNREAERLLGIAAAAARGRPVEEALPPELSRAVAAAGEADAAAGREVACRLPGGDQRFLEIAVGRITDGEGGFAGSVLIMKDLAEIRALQGEVARHQRLAAVGRLAAGVAHEIRNPLSSIKGFATYFRERYRDHPEDQRIAGILIQEVDRLNRVVGQLLEFSRPIEIQPRPVAPARLIEESLSLAASPIAAKQIAVHTEVAAAGPELRVDPDRMRQVLLNLYLNAVEAMDPGGKLTVAVKAADEGGAVLIEVADTGCGIPPEHLGQVFEPYFTTKPAGTGLGLAIAHNIVEAMGAAIAVSSRPGKGTTFTLRVPR